MEIADARIFQNRFYAGCAIIEYKNPFTKEYCLFNVMGDNDETELSLTEDSQQPVLQTFPGDGVNRRERFIKEKKGRAKNQSPCQSYPLALTTAQLMGIEMVKVFNAKDTFEL